MILEDAKYERIGYEDFRGLPDYYSRYRTAACATISQISCMMGLIKEYRFADGSKVANVAEVGVNVGLTDLYLLKAGVKYNKDFRLWGIEKMTDGHMGGVVRKEATEEELAHWSFCCGKTVFDMDTFLPGDVALDMVFIDGAHAHPYPLIDLVYLLPRMREDGLILLHDCEYYSEYGELGNSYIYSSWIGEKYLNKNIANPDMQIAGEETLGIVTVPDAQTMQMILERVAAIPIDKPYHRYASEEQRKKGEYLGISSADVLNEMYPHMFAHYDADFVRRFMRTFTRTLSEYEENEVYRFHKSRIIHYYFERINDLQRQIDELRGGGYQVPWDRIPPHAHVILYGGSEVGKVYYRKLQANHYATVDMVCDKRHEQVQAEWSVPVCPPDGLGDVSGKVILLATESEVVAEEMREDLKKAGIVDTNVIWSKP